ncbi:MAG: efflux transporter outer membrane subunit [Alphaproteobacteria bacterium]|nr:efflux transporter outer membrane subunit [Alphaproteobacteria bacterium]
MKLLCRITALIVLTSLAACEAGPDYKRPPVETPASYKEAYGEWRQARPQDALDRGAWWTIYKDPVLDGLEKQVDLSNQNVKAAEAAYREAEAAVEETRSGLFPTVTADSTVGDMHGTMPRPMMPESLYGTASWVPDVWGRIRRDLEGSEAGAQVSAADLASARLSMQAALATDYFNLRAQDELKRLLDTIAETDKKALQIVQSQYDTGTGAMADVLMAQTQLENVQSKATNAGIRRAKLEHAIAVLIGKPPADLSLAAAKYIDYAPEIPVGVPSSLLERRPDIAASERMMTAANAKIGMATAAWFPDITLSASAGYTSMALKQLLQASNTFWVLGAGIAETLFDAGKREAKIEEAHAGYDRSVAMYRQTVLAAFQQVEDNLAALRILADQRKTQEAAVDHARLAERLAFQQYTSGTAPYNNVLTAQSTHLENEVTLLNIRQSRLNADVALIQALGGGWTSSQLSPESDSDEKISHNQ